MVQGNGRIDFADFPQTFKGLAVRPGDDGYADARQIPNARHDDQQPTLIARCTDADDVVTAVNYAVDKNIDIAVRSGGHGMDGFAMPDGAFVIDTSPMRRIEIDPETRIVRIDAGVLLGELDVAAQGHGLAVPMGTVSATGAAGLTLGGGLGYLTRRFGATVDNLISVDVVTVDGRKLTVSEAEHPELFWGLRGAGHNLAIATSFTYRAHRVGPDIVSGLIIYPIEETAPILAGIDAALAEAPRELTLYPVVLPAPPLPGLPESMIGTPIFVLIVVYTGDRDAYEDAMTSVRPLGKPLADMAGPTQWLDAQRILDVLAPPGRRQQSRSGNLGSLTEEMAQIAVQRVQQSPAPPTPGPSTAIAFALQGGALLDTDEDAMAFSRAGLEWCFEILGQWDPPESDGEFMGWAEDTLNAFIPFERKNGYINYSTDRGADWLRGLYGSEEKWARLCALKAEWDPDNRLSHNKNLTRAQAELSVGSSSVGA